MGFPAVWSYTIASVTIWKRFMKCYLKLLRVQDKEDLAEDDRGVPTLPNNYSLVNIKVTSLQIKKNYNGWDFIPC